MLVVGLLLLVAVGSFAVGLGIFLESKRTRSFEQKTFAVATMIISLWTVVNAALLLPDQYGNTGNVTLFNAINRSGFLLGALLLTLIYVFGLFYPTKKKIGLFAKFVVGFGIILTMLAPLSVIAGKFVVQSDKLQYQTGALGSVIAVLALLVIVGIYTGNAKLLRQTHNELLRKQATTLLAGLTLTIVHGALFILVLPHYFHNRVTVYAIGYFAPYYFLSFTVYGLLRHQLFDIRLIVSRSVAYLMSLVAVASAYGFLVFGAADLIFNLHFSLGLQIFISAATAAASLSFASIKRFFDRTTNRLFFRDSYDTQVFFDDFNQTLVETYELDELLKESIKIIGQNIKPAHCQFVINKTAHTEGRVMGTSNKPELGEEDLKIIKEAVGKGRHKLIVADDLEGGHKPLQKQLRAKDIVLAAALSSTTGGRKTEVGYLLLGPKKSGNLYSSQDIKVLEIVANELVIAVQNALRFEEIESFNITLQAKVDEATKKLRRANEKLKALDETKDDFISMASHQLRTPLTSVKGYISMVLEGDTGKITPKQKDMLGQAFFSSQRMVYLIADLLNVSRLKTGKFVIDSVPVNLADVVDQELGQLKETAAAHSLKLTYDKPRKFPELMLDETKTRQVIMNFVDNAIYYTPSGGEIKVRLIESPTTIELRVEDNGIGVPASEKPHMFTKFYRAGNARKARPDGTGLGLFMAKKVIASQGGSLVFESQEGKGSTFGFVFSKAKHAVSAKAPTVKTPPPPPTAAARA